MLAEHLIQLREVALNCARTAGGGSPLLLLHGVTRRWQSFLPVVPALALRRQVWGVDLRGHGRSESGAQFGVVDYVRDIVELVEEHVPERVVVYGHSLGAMVALAVAAALPDAVAALVLEDPPFDTMGARIAQTPLLSYFQGVRELAGHDRPLAELTAAAGNLRFCDPQNGRNVMLRDVRDPAALRFTASCLARLDPRVLDSIVAGTWLAGFERDTLLRRINAPTLLLQADPAQGGMLTDDDADVLRRSIPDCTHVRIPRAGHLLHVERSVEVSGLLLNFLESLEEGGAPGRLVRAASATSIRQRHGSLSQ